MQARELGDIGKTNLLKMDKKVNKAIRKILDRDVPQYELTLADRIMNSNHLLPQPSNHTARPMGPQSQIEYFNLESGKGAQFEVPFDLAHWKSLPTDVK